MTGANYSLTGGFWSLYALQTPGAPALSINLATANWEPPAEAVQDDGTIRYITVNPPTGNRYYRLKSP